MFLSKNPHIEIHYSDNKKILQQLEENSVDAIVTDPPYGIEFMSQKWDYDVPDVETWELCLRVLKPGAHLLAFFGTRTYHRGVVNIEDAGFEIRDQIQWVYGTGFPKNHDISKAIDKIKGAEREVVGNNPNYRKMQDDPSAYNLKRNPKITAPKTKEAKSWNGWGTALKPAHEPIVIARKPIPTTVAENVLSFGTGGINIDECRVPLHGEDNPKGSAKRVYASNEFTEEKKYGENKETPDEGRYPANLIHDGSIEVIENFPSDAGGHGMANGPSLREENKSVARGKFQGLPEELDPPFYADSGSAARFFYCAKATTEDREEGLKYFQPKKMDQSRKEGDPGGDNPRNRGVNKRKNNHQTVKPTRLMRYLVRLVTPKNGIVLDPYMGSGSTGKACAIEHFGFIGIEKKERFFEISKARIQHKLKTPKLNL